jgi:hypothetical protein
MKIALNSSQLAAAARLFSSAVVKEMARTGRSPMFGRLANESGLASLRLSEGVVGNFFDEAFSLLKKKAYRYEYVYKAAVTHKLLLGVHSLRSASMLSEFRIGACKADLVILNGTSTVYEVKSERDNLDRLKSQIAAYRKVFARVNVIAAEEHISCVTANVPAEVGILVLNDRYRISTIREAENRPEAIDSCAVFESLTKEEALQVLERLGYTRPNVPNTRFHAEMLRIFAEIAPVNLHECMLGVLKETRSLRPLSSLIQELPKSLQTAVITTPLHQRDYSNLIAAVNTPISEAFAWS